MEKKLNLLILAPEVRTSPQEKILIEMDFNSK